MRRPPSYPLATVLNNVDSTAQLTLPVGDTGLEGRNTPHDNSLNTNGYESGLSRYTTRSDNGSAVEAAPTSSGKPTLAERKARIAQAIADFFKRHNARSSLLSPSDADRRFGEVVVQRRRHGRVVKR